MKIYKVCHVAFYKSNGIDRVCIPDFVCDVRVYTSKRKAIKDALRSVSIYRDNMGYEITAVNLRYLRSWALEADGIRRDIYVIEEVTK